MSPSKKATLSQVSLYTSAITGLATLIIGVFSSYVVFWRAGSYIDRIEQATQDSVKVDEFNLWALTTQLRNGTNWIPANMADIHKDAPSRKPGG